MVIPNQQNYRPKQNRWVPKKGSSPAQPAVEQAAQSVALLTIAKNVSQLPLKKSNEVLGLAAKKGMLPEPRRESTPQSVSSLRSPTFEKSSSSSSVNASPSVDPKSVKERLSVAVESHLPINEEDSLSASALDKAAVDSQSKSSSSSSSSSPVPKSSQKKRSQLNLNPFSSFGPAAASLASSASPSFGILPFPPLLSSGSYTPSARSYTHSDSSSSSVSSLLSRPSPSSSSSSSKSSSPLLSTPSPSPSSSSSSSSPSSALVSSPSSARTGSIQWDASILEEEKEIILELLNDIKKWDKNKRDNSDYSKNQEVSTAIAEDNRLIVLKGIHQNADGTNTYHITIQLPNSRKHHIYIQRSPVVIKSKKSKVAKDIWIVIAISDGTRAFDRLLSSQGLFW